MSDQETQPGHIEKEKVREYFNNENSKNDLAKVVAGILTDKPDLLSKLYGALLDEGSTAVEDLLEGYDPDPDYLYESESDGVYTEVEDEEEQWGAEGEISDSDEEDEKTQMNFIQNEEESMMIIGEIPSTDEESSDEEFVPVEDKPTEEDQRYSLINFDEIREDMERITQDEVGTITFPGHERTLVELTDEQTALVREQTNHLVQLMIQMNRYKDNFLLSDRLSTLLDGLEKANSVWNQMTRRRLEVLTDLKFPHDSIKSTTLPKTFGSSIKRLRYLSNTQSYKTALSQCSFEYDENYDFVPNDNGTQSKNPLLFSEKTLIRFLRKSGKPRNYISSIIAASHIHIRKVNAFHIEFDATVAQLQYFGRLCKKMKRWRPISEKFCGDPGYSDFCRGLFESVVLNSDFQLAYFGQTVEPPHKLDEHEWECVICGKRMETMVDWASHTLSEHVE
ncbi:hypothetical protein PCE1_002195 [Barthelona sp. PCE]